MENLLCEEGTERIGGKVADQRTVVRYGYNARFFGHDDRDGIARLTDADGGSVSRAEITVDIGATRQGQKASRRGDPPLVHDDSAVVKGRFIEEQIAEQEGIDVRVDADTVFVMSVYLYRSRNSSRQRPCSMI